MNRRCDTLLKITIGSVIVFSLLLLFSINGSTESMSNATDIETLAEDEIDMERLKKLLAEPIWRYAIAAWQVGEYSIFCETSGFLQCPVPGLT